MKTGIELIAEERQRQIEKEGWTPKHDAGHKNGELANAAATYAMTKEALEVINLNIPEQLQPAVWPFEKIWYKPTQKDRIRELQKAGALIAAEIDRLQRL